MVTNGDILRVALQWFADGISEVVNVHHFRVEDVGTTTDDLDFMLALGSTLADELYDVVFTAVADNIVGAVINAFNVTQGVTMPPVSNNIDGVLSVSEGYARQVTALVFINGNAPRRQGRSYLPPFTEAAVGDDGAWDAGILSNLADYAAKLVGVITDGDIAVQRVITHPDGSAPIVPAYGGWSTYPRTQRRRTPGFGS